MQFLGRGGGGGPSIIFWSQNTPKSHFFLNMVIILGFFLWRPPTSTCCHTPLTISNNFLLPNPGARRHKVSEKHHAASSRYSLRFLVMGGGWGSEKILDPKICHIFNVVFFCVFRLPTTNFEGLSLATHWFEEFAATRSWSAPTQSFRKKSFDGFYVNNAIFRQGGWGVPTKF